jgi:AcrR family transcriptional regulator
MAVTGRPRDADLELRLLEAGWQLLVDEGYAALTPTRVAAGAGAHRTDVYRRWSTKALLVVQVLEQHLPPVPAFDTGSLRSDVAAYVDALAQSWSQPWIDGLVGLMADLRDDVEAELRFRQLGERRGEPMRAAVARAVERGDLAAPPDLALLGDVLEGPLMHRRLVGRQPLPAEHMAAVSELAYRFLLSQQAVR